MRTEGLITRNVLFVGTGVPWNGFAGYHIRQKILIDSLQDLGSLHLVLFDDGAGEAPKNLPQGIFSLHWVDQKKVSSERAEGFFADLLNPLPRMMRSRADADTVCKIQEFIDELNPEIILVYRVELLLASGLHGGPNIYLDIDDPEHVRRLRAEQLRGPIDFRTRIDLIKLARLERLMARSCRMAFVCQEEDSRHFFPPAHIVPNAVTLPAKVAAGHSVRKNIIFVGNLSAHGANSDGLAWFIEKVWPIFLQKVSGIALRIIGRGAEKFIQDRAADRTIEAVGFVEQLDDEYRAAAFAIAPIRYGTGTRIKILEAMAHACPVVATTLGASGIVAVPGVHICIADDPEDMATAMQQLISDVGKRESIGDAGRELVARQYERSTVVAHLSKAIAADHMAHNREKRDEIAFDAAN